MVIEPRLSQQWFVKIEPLAEKAIRAVEEGHIRFTPDQYRKTYNEWMTNIHDWCISRQLVVGASDSGVALRGLPGDYGVAGDSGGLLEVRVGGD